MIVPRRSVVDEDMGIRPYREGRVEAAGRDDEATVLLDIGQGRAAARAEGSGVSRPRQHERGDVVLAAYPAQCRRGGKQVGGMRRPGVLPAAVAMAEEEAVESAIDLEAHGSAEAGTPMVAHQRQTPR